MSDIRICVRDHAGDHWTDIHGSMGDRLIAACSRTPRTLAELCAACEHYAKGSTAWVKWFQRGRKFERVDAGLVIIDLTARLIVVDSRYSHPQLVDQVAYHNGQYRTREMVNYDLTCDQWWITTRSSDWQGLARVRLLHLQGIVDNDPEQTARTFGCERDRQPVAQTTA